MRYTQIFRNGCVEVVVAFTATALQQKYLPVLFVEKEIIERLHEGKQFLEQLGVTPPLVVAVSIVGVRDWNIVGRHGRASRSRFDRDPLLLPDLSLTTFDGETPTELRPVIDYLWNAAGEPASPSYNQEGEYRPG